MKWLAIGILPLALAGCLEGNKNTDQLCQSNSALLMWTAQYERRTMPCGTYRSHRHRFEVLKQPTEINKIKEFELVASYVKILSGWLHKLKPSDQSKLQERRFTALMHSIEESERIVKELSQSDTPEATLLLVVTNWWHQCQTQFLAVRRKKKR